MKPPFSLTAGLYDTIYDSKDYLGESRFVKDLLESLGLELGSILDIGCGTGKHLWNFHQWGHQVTGIDKSEEMIKQAKANFPEISNCFFQNDSFKNDHQFDAVISLFHVLSYQTKTEDLEEYFNLLKRLLKPGGKFVIDFWNYDAVISQGTEIRTKRFNWNGQQITRTVRPFKKEDDLIDVHIEMKVDGGVLNECHSMRAFKGDELVCEMEKFGFKVMGIHPWGDRSKRPTNNDWTAFIIGEVPGE